MPAVIRAKLSLQCEDISPRYSGGSAKFSSLIFLCACVRESIYNRIDVNILDGLRVCMLRTRVPLSSSQEKGGKRPRAGEISD